LNWNYICTSCYNSAWIVMSYVHTPRKRIAWIVIRTCIEKCKHVLVYDPIQVPPLPSWFNKKGLDICTPFAYLVNVLILYCNFRSNFAHVCTTWIHNAHYLHACICETRNPVCIWVSIRNQTFCCSCAFLALENSNSRIVASKMPLTYMHMYICSILLEFH
jgi:hypothetical protein